MKVHGSIIRLPLFGIFDRNLQPLIPRTPDGADPVTRHQMTLIFSKNNDFTGFDFRLTRRQFFFDHLPLAQDLCFIAFRIHRLGLMPTESRRVQQIVIGLLGLIDNPKLALDIIAQFLHAAMGLAFDVNHHLSTLRFSEKPGTPLIVDL
jgi:hypothetical protein